MEHVQACLSGRDDRESSFDRSGSPVLLVQACLCAGKACYHHFNLGSGAVKHV